MKFETRVYVRCLSMVMILLISSGCSQLGYYLQSAKGHFEVMNQRQSIEELITNPDTDPKLVQRLKRVLSIREYGMQQLGLPKSGSYTRYADLQRDYVLKNLFATTEFSITPESWCYPVVGCASYRGYFDEQQMQAFIRDLQQQGEMDIYVGNVPAYSTLGWFDDPVLNTFIHWPDEHLAGLIFHELTHQLIYVSGDSRFNESLATAVQQVGVESWLKSEGKTETLQKYRQFLNNRRSVIDLIIKKRQELQKLYATTIDTLEKRAGKQTIIQELKRQFQVMSEQFEVKTGFAAWFERDINNAQLASVSTYHDYVPAFRNMLSHLHGDFAAFYRQVERIAELSPSSRERCMDYWDQPPSATRMQAHPDCY